MRRGASRAARVALGLVGPQPAADAAGAAAGGLDAKVEGLEVSEQVADHSPTLWVGSEMVMGALAGAVFGASGSDKEDDRVA